MWVMTNHDSKPEFQGARQRGGDAQQRVGSRGTATAPMLRKQTGWNVRRRNLKPPALAIPTAGVAFPPEWMVLRASGNLPGNKTASHPMSKSSSPYTGENKPRRNADWGLWWRSFSARCRWLDPSRSKSVSRAILEPILEPKNGIAAKKFGF